MNRKQFVATFLPATLAMGFSKSLIAQHTTGREANTPARMPAYLQQGDTIAITCPASPLEMEDARDCITSLKCWGYNVVMGDTVGTRWQRFGGTDAARLDDFQRYLDDDAVSAILFGRGGYGVMRMMDQINWDKFIEHPKWLIGYSDITALHCHINKTFQIPTIHADMANGFHGTADEAEVSIRRVLAGKPINYDFDGALANRPGMVNAEMVGGNLSLIYAMQASQSELDTNNKILLIEDVSEYKYTIDRMLLNLKRSGKLDNLAALAVGGFTAMKEEKDSRFPMSIEDIIMEKVKEYDYPVCFGFPAGHQKMNLALKLGMRYQFTIGNSFCNLTEMPAPTEAIEQ